uniref:Uncharacterized protein n=1 Tax=Nelumbo nucifera TaxID=4432 RepID=A0A823A1E2_NELNU|nr:TPA_asm: hypothetical protein HUJ06_019066 [Nelumbo nucifera]
MTRIPSLDVAVNQPFHFESLDSRCPFDTLTLSSCLNVFVICPSLQATSYFSIYLFSSSPDYLFPL